MKSHLPDSAHAATLFGTILAWVLANAAPLSATLCALVGTAYTVWKWRREIRKARREDSHLD